MAAAASPDGAAVALHKAVFAALAADDALRTLIGEPVRLYDAVPDPNKATKPYVTFGAHDENDESAVCAPGVTYDGAEHDLTLHVWSGAVGAIEAKKIAARLRAVLNTRTLTVADHHPAEIMHRDTHTLPGGNGTTHAVLMFTAILEPAF